MADHLSLDTSPAASRKAKGQPAVRKPAAPRTLSLAEQNAAIRERTGIDDYHGLNGGTEDLPGRGIFQLSAPRGFVRLQAQDDDGFEVASLMVPADLYDSYHVEVLREILDCCDPFGRPRPSGKLTLVLR